MSFEHCNSGSSSVYCYLVFCSFVLGGHVVLVVYVVQW